MYTPHKKRTLGILLFDRFETLDACGPIELFGSLPEYITLVTVAEHAGPIRAAHGIDVIAQHDFEFCPKLDILLVPGGKGTRVEMTNPVMLAWLRDQHESVELLTSVCTGSFLLAAAGLLEGRRATSNKLCFEEALAIGSNINWIREARWVEDGEFFTSSGVSAGLDMSLAVIEHLYGTPSAEGVARHAEYLWNRDPGEDPFALPAAT